MKKILIIKMGYSETLDPEIGKIASLGDVLRSSVVLEPLKKNYPNAKITWLVSQEALLLIKNNPYVDRILVWDEFMPLVLMRERYDMVINLEKINGICALTDMINAWEKVGFRFNSETGNFDTYSKSMNAKVYIESKNENNGSNRQYWQKIILEMIGLEWHDQEYSLGYQPESNEEYPVGFNYLVGYKWPHKAMPINKWKELEILLQKEGVGVSWQQGENDLHEYMNWINSCRVIVTNDSLGMHIALALKKRVIALFSSTGPDEVYMYNRGVSIVPQTPYDCIPCYLKECFQPKLCVDFFDVQLIYNAIITQLVSSESLN